MRRVAAALATAIAASSALAPSAEAGGFDRGQQNIDLLFATDSYVMSSQMQVVAPDFRYSSVTAAPDILGLGTAHDDPVRHTILLPRVDIKVGYGNTDCLGTYSTPFRALSSHAADWVGQISMVDKELRVDELALTCSQAFALGAGSIRVIGGVSYEMGSYDQTRNATALDANGLGLGITSIDIGDNGWGWRAGLGYELPAYALQASLMYYSAVTLNATGTVDNLPLFADLTDFFPDAIANGVPVYADAVEIPQAVELRLQSGIAPGWLASASVKWQDWSVWQDTVIHYVDPTTPSVESRSVQRFRDGWTVGVGLGHQLTDRLAVGGGLSWDRGVSTGYTENTDVWTLSAGLRYALTANLDLTVGGAVSLWTGGEITETAAGYTATWDDSYVWSTQVGLKAHF